MVLEAGVIHTDKRYIMKVGACLKFLKYEVCGWDSMRHKLVNNLHPWTTDYMAMYS